ncbi:hypothetical protein, partial [Vibrio anguillarum]|uniref:hypothetical protein n=1 Tax=Vibrio anguillarum TaxID=55601 RepID=UPI001BE467F3
MTNLVVETGVRRASLHVGNAVLLHSAPDCDLQTRLVGTDHMDSRQMVLTAPCFYTDVGNAYTRLSHRRHWKSP